MSQQKTSWTYTTRYHLEGEKGLFFPVSTPSSVTSADPWTGIGSRDGTERKPRPSVKTTAFSCHYIITQPTQDPRSMEVSSPTEHDRAPDKLANVTNRKLYDDPAFSPDPLTNPLFTSHLPPAWSSPPGPGHPTLQRRRQVVDGEEFYPPQPPNTPTVPEPEAAAADNKSRSHLPESTASSNPATTSDRDTPPSIDSTSPSPSALLVPAVQLPSSPPSSAPTGDPSSSEPHVQPRGEDNRMPHRAHHQAFPSQHLQQAPFSKPKPKKRQGFFARLLGSPSSTESSQSNASSPPKPSNHKLQRSTSMLRTQRPQTTHSRNDVGPRPAPVPQPVPIPHNHSRSAPDLHRSERPPMPQRAKTVGINAETGRSPIVPAVAAAAAAGHAADDRRLRQDLDRIDELDETNPFGQAVHHGGPYEAISRVVQKDATSGRDERPPQIQATGGRNLVVSGDVYRHAQLMALQASLNLRPGQILPHDFAQYPESTQSYPHSHSVHPGYPQLQPQPDPDRHHNRPYPQQQPSRHHDRHINNDYAQAGLPASESRSPSERPVHPQKVPLVLHVEGSLRNFPTVPSAPPPTNSPPTRQRTPSPTAATNNSDDEDAGFAIGMALMSAGQNHSHTTDATTVVGTGSELNSPVPIKIVLREPTDADEVDPPPYALVPPQASTSQIAGPLLYEYRSQEPALVDQNHTGEIWNTFPDPPQFQPFPGQVHSSHFVPVPTPVPTTSSSRYASWHPQPSQATPPQLYTRSSRRDIQSLQPLPPPQLYAAASNSGLSRSSTYAPGFSGPSIDRPILVAASPRSTSGTPPHSSLLSLRDRESDNRSVQQSIMTNSNASSRSQGENPRRNRYLPKRLVMPAPLQPMMQNQATMHQVRFDPQANIIHPPARAPSPPRAKASTFSPRPYRAQEIPIAQSNGKLRKRSSLFGGVKESAQPPVTAVSFSANIVSADRHARGAEKVHKKVLSKRK